MGHQIIMQPDGKLAVFSSVVDDWITTDATPEEILDEFVQDAARQARVRTQYLLDAVLSSNPQGVYNQLAMTFEEANAKAKEPLTRFQSQM